MAVINRNYSFQERKGNIVVYCVTQLITHGMSALGEKKLGIAGALDNQKKFTCKALIFDDG